VKSMNKNALINEEQTKLLIETIGKNAWSGAAPVVRVDAWSNFHQSPDSLRNYLCKDGSGYIRGYCDGDGTFYVKRFHLRDEEWTDSQSAQS
jgi:hypothetical protein